MTQKLTWQDQLGRVERRLQTAAFKVLLLCLVLFATNASAQPEWSTYCDNGVEKVQLELTYQLGEVESVESALADAYNNDICEPFNYCGPQEAFTEYLGEGNYRFTWRGWLRSCLTVDTPSFHALVFFYVSDPEPKLFLTEIWCNQFDAVEIVDNVECTPLPAKAATWGAVKVMYQPKGGKP
jgi:hypothetical protein